MKKISELLGKPVISIYNGNIEGFINNVFCNDKLTKIEYLQFFDDENQGEKLSSIKNIYHIGEDAITIKNNDDVFVENTIMNVGINPINFDLYTINGKKVSKISDVEFNDKFAIKNIICQDGQTLSSKQILKLGKNVAIKSESKNAVKISNFKSKAKILNSDSHQNIKVEIQNELPLIPKSKISPLPKKLVTGGYEFLIGRKVDKNIYSDNKELIIKKQSKITSAIIDVASKNGKLKELTTSSIA